MLLNSHQRDIYYVNESSKYILPYLLLVFFITTSQGKLVIYKCIVQIVENALDSGYENVLLVAKAYRKLAMNAEKKLLLLEDYCSSETFKVKERAIRNWEKELEAIKEEKLQAIMFDEFHC